MVCRGDLTCNWEFFKQQWQDCEVATSLDQKDPEESIDPTGNFSFSYGKGMPAKFRKSYLWYRGTDDQFST